MATIRSIGYVGWGQTTAPEQNWWFLSSPCRCSGMWCWALVGIWTDWHVFHGILSLVFGWHRFLLTVLIAVPSAFLWFSPACSWSCQTICFAADFSSQRIRSANVLIAKKVRCALAWAVYSCISWHEITDQIVWRHPLWEDWQTFGNAFLLLQDWRRVYNHVIIFHVGMHFLHQFTYLWAGPPRMVALSRLHAHRLGIEQGTAFFRRPWDQPRASVIFFFTEFKATKGLEPRRGRLNEASPNLAMKNECFFQYTILAVVDVNMLLKGKSWDQNLDSDTPVISGLNLPKQYESSMTIP